MSSRLKVKLINPSRCLGHGELMKAKQQLFPTLTFPLLAALAPPDVEVTAQDELFEDIDFAERVDLVGITAHTMQAGRAYEVADEFRRRGVPVVMGGIHVSMVPEEAAAHADTVIVGEAEETWPRFLDDFKNGRAKPLYKAERFPSLANLPTPRFSVLDLSRYVSCNRRGLYRLAPTPILPVQTSRGCPHHCEFCSVAVFNGRECRTRPIGEVVEEIKALGLRGALFTDDNIFADPPRAKALFEALIPLRLVWMGQGTIAAAEDRELLDLCRRSGGQLICAGLESLSPVMLRLMGKTHNVAADYARHIKAYRDAGISLCVSMMFGFGPEEPSVFAETCDFLVRNRVTFTHWLPVRATPGTPLFDRFRREGRLKRVDWWVDRDLTARFDELRHTGVEMGEGIFWETFHREMARFYSAANIARRLLLPPQKRWLMKAFVNYFVLRRRLDRVGRTSLFEA